MEARDRYRTERDAAREELAAVQARVNALIRSDVERVAGESLAMPGDFWLLSGNDVDAYLDDQGNVDYERVREDARLLLEERPLLGKRSLAVDHSQGRGNGIGNREPTWSALLTD
ncbi:hypothetical protein CYL16_03315 [Mycobacterium sp. EPG1]|nr:hypothetical protein CYL16_03315 [Mycobacterium sp. EPG1]